MKNNIDINEVIQVLTTADGEEYRQAWYHFSEVMQKAVRGCIATRERMILLYPIFRQIADEVDLTKATEEYERKRYETQQARKRLKAYANG